MTATTFTRSFFRCHCRIQSRPEEGATREKLLYNRPGLSPISASLLSVVRHGSVPFSRCGLGATMHRATPFFLISHPPPMSHITFQQQQQQQQKKRDPVAATAAAIRNIPSLAAANRAPHRIRLCRCRCSAVTVLSVVSTATLNCCKNSHATEMLKNRKRTPRNMRRIEKCHSHPARAWRGGKQEPREHQKETMRPRHWTWCSEMAILHDTSPMGLRFSGVGCAWTASS